MRRVAAGTRRWAKGLFVRVRVTSGRQARLFRALYLRHTSVVHDKLNDTETEPFDFFAHERDPVGRRGGGIGFRRRCRHDDGDLNGVFGEQLVKDALGDIESRGAGIAGEPTGVTRGHAGKRGRRIGLRRKG